MEQVPISLPLVGGKSLPLQHPLGPLTSAEISESTRLIKELWPTNVDLQFKTITLQEPSKANLTPYLDAEHAGRPLPNIERRSFVVYYIRQTVSNLNER